MISPQQTYEEMIKHVHNVGFIYSSFIEVILANIYVNKNNIILRYAYNDPKEDNRIHKKYSIKKIHTLIKGEVLSFLYEPNVNSLTAAYENFDHESQLDKEKMNIFEKIWRGLL